MAGWRRKQNTNTLSTIVSGLTILCVVLLLLGVVSSQTQKLKEKEEAYAAEEERLTAEYQDLKDKAGELEEKRIYVQTKQFVEEMAKSRLGLVKPGEMILRPGN